MDTIGDAMRHGYLLKISCKSCGHFGFHDPGAMLTAYQRFMKLDDLRFDCTKCKKRNYDLTVIEPSMLPDEDYIIWTPVRAKRKLKVGQSTRSE